MAFGDALKGLSERLDQERREQAALGEARRLLRWLDSNSHRITLHEGDRLSVSPRPPEDVAEMLRRAKPSLLILLRQAQAAP